MVGRGDRRAAVGHRDSHLDPGHRRALQPPAAPLSGVHRAHLLPPPLRRGSRAGRLQRRLSGRNGPGAHTRGAHARDPGDGAAGTRVAVTGGEVSEEAALSVSHLTKRFRGRTALEDVSFQVARGEVFGFLGPNGAGKTTTVRTLSTLIAPTSGSAVVAGVPLIPANGEEIRQRISVMPENPGLYLRLTVQENLELFARLY